MHWFAEPGDVSVRQIYICLDHGGPRRHPSTVTQYVSQACDGLRDALSLFQKCIEMHLGG